MIRKMTAIKIEEFTIRKLVTKLTMYFIPLIDRENSYQENKLRIDELTWQENKEATSKRRIIGRTEQQIVSASPCKLEFATSYLCISIKSNAEIY